MAEISTTLRDRFRASADDPAHLEAVIVTLAPAADAGVLDAAGMQVAHRMRNRPIVTGRVTAATLDALAQSAAVVRIESDGEMRALDE